MIAKIKINLGKLCLVRRDKKMRKNVMVRKNYEKLENNKIKGKH